MFFPRPVPGLLGGIPPLHHGGFLSEFLFFTYFPFGDVALRIFDFLSVMDFVSTRPIFSLFHLNSSIYVILRLFSLRKREVAFPF